MRKWILRIGILMVALAIGAVQENWKIDINYVLDLHVHIPNYDVLSGPQRAQALKACHAYMPYDYYFNHDNNLWILNLEIGTLKKLKWILTVLFSILFFGANFLIIQSFSPDKMWLKLLKWAYPITLVVAFCIYYIGRNSAHDQATYAIAREMMGALQSLIPAMLIIPILYLHRNFENK